MEGKQSEYDFLNFAKDYSIKNNITREEEIQFSDKIKKINKNGWKQDRNILLTDKAIYNLKKTSLKRRIDYKTIRGITLSKLSDEFVIHCEELDYDYHYISSRKKTIVEILAKNYEIVKEDDCRNCNHHNQKNVQNFHNISVFKFLVQSFCSVSCSMRFAPASSFSIFLPGSARLTEESIVVSSAILSIVLVRKNSQMAAAVSTRLTKRVTCPAHGDTAVSLM